MTRKQKKMRVRILAAAVLLLAAKLLPMFSEGMRILLLTIVISAAAAVRFPRRRDAEDLFDEQEAEAQEREAGI